MAQEWKNEHYVANNTRQRASRGSRGWWVQWALRPWRLCVRSHKEPFWQRLLHQLPKLLVPAFLDFRWAGGVLTSHCYSYEAMCMGFTAVTKRSGIDGQNQGDLISRLAWSSECRRSKWLKGKNMSLRLIADVNVTSYAFQFHSHSIHTLNTFMRKILWTPKQNQPLAAGSPLVPPWTYLRVIGLPKESNAATGMTLRDFRSRWRMRGYLDCQVGGNMGFYRDPESKDCKGIQYFVPGSACVRLSGFFFSKLPKTQELICPKLQRFFLGISGKIQVWMGNSERALKLQFFHRDDGSHVEVRSVLLKMFLGDFSHHLGALGGEKSVQKNTPNGNSWKLKACRLSEIPEVKVRRGSLSQNLVRQSLLCHELHWHQRQLPHHHRHQQHQQHHRHHRQHRHHRHHRHHQHQHPQRQLLPRSLRFQARRLYLYRRWWQMEKGKWQKSLGKTMETIPIPE